MHIFIMFFMLKNILIHTSVHTLELYKNCYAIKFWQDDCFYHDQCQFELSHITQKGCQKCQSIILNDMFCCTGLCNQYT